MLIVVITPQYVINVMVEMEWYRIKSIDALLQKYYNTSMHCNITYCIGP